MEPLDPVPNDERFELVRRIARGGGGTVWHAHDRTLDRAVALKQVEIPGELASGDRDDAKQRVLREAKAAARLRHPGVVTLFDVLDGGDVVQLVMELVEAPTLRQVVDRHGPLREAEAARLGLALLDVLEQAHTQGIVHRDLKPSNVFVHEGGRTQLADFGIASIAGESTLTHADTALGSPDFIAPEQAQGARAAPEADLWSLGATLYLAVEGVAPFARSGVIPTLQAVVHDARRAYHRAGDLQPVLDGLLHKDPAERPSLTQLRADLEQVADGRSAAGHTAPLAIPPDGADPDGTVGSGLEDSATPQVGTATEGAEAESDAPSEEDEAHPSELEEAHDAPPSEQVPAGTEADASWRRPALLVAGVVALLALAGAATWMTTGADLPDDEPEVAEAPDEEADAEDGDGSEGGEADAEGGSNGVETVDDPGDADGEQDTLSEASEVPDDWQTAVGSTYRVAIPGTWQEQDAGGNRTDFVDPDTGAYLRVDHTDDPAPDPLADWETAAADFADRHDGYEQVRLERVTYRDYDAAVWEYRYRDGGVELRAINLNIVDDDHAYALNLQSPQDEWDRVEEHMPFVMAGFRPER
jgi:eukaryotic-like serine/threonine-protein kinase